MFHFHPSRHRGFVATELISDRGGHEPSREDDIFAPFYPDPSQRIFAVEISNSVGILVMKTEQLLRLAQERRGEDLQWEEWKAHAIQVPHNRQRESIWVAGHRLFCVARANDEKPSMDVYDFGVRASARYKETVEGRMGRRFEPTASRILPWDDIAASCGCHDSITFVSVKIPATLKFNLNWTNRGVL